MSRPAPSFALVVSDYHAEYTQGLLDAAQSVLSPHPQTVVHVPGAFEIPLQVQRLARSGQFTAILAFGLVWQGETLHNLEILRAVTDSLIRIALETDTPVLHEVLSVRTARQARERCLKSKQNRGREAALAALALLEIPTFHLATPSPKLRRVHGRSS